MSKTEDSSLRGSKAFILSVMGQMARLFHSRNCPRQSSAFFKKMWEYIRERGDGSKKKRPGSVVPLEKRH